MCGIVAAINGTSVINLLMTGLGNLEYRGYDSAGIAVMQQDRLALRRQSGKLTNLQASLEAEPVDGPIGIGHTRWATHGKANQENAHPHRAGPVAVVHNGIIENHAALRQDLERSGAVFASDTDSEVIPHLIASALSLLSEPEEAIRHALQQIDGAFALAIMIEGYDDQLYLARQGSPLCIGRGTDCLMVGSSVQAFPDQIADVTFLEDGDIARVSKSAIAITTPSGASADRPFQPYQPGVQGTDKGDYRHFMHKEIHEQPAILQQLLETGLPNNIAPWFQGKTWLRIIACGSSAYAAHTAKYWLETYTKLRVEVELASECRYRPIQVRPDDIALVVSQSGETADSLAALRYLKQEGMTVLALVNSLDSSIAREADDVIPIGAGPEIGVASTKAFTAQLMRLAQLTLSIAPIETAVDFATHKSALKALALIPYKMGALLADEDLYQKAAQQIAQAQSAMFVGRGTSYPLALEGALKLKEISYIHAEGFAAGELKHGPIALVDEQTPTIVLAPSDLHYQKTLSNLSEIRSRGGPVILIADMVDFKDTDMVLPSLSGHLISDPILLAIPLQLLAYHVALIKGTDIDQPRNLAKSVTVE